MIKFLFRRILFLIFSLFVVSIIVFAISELAPGNIAVNTLGPFITPEQEASFNAQHGLDQPALIRYLRWLIGSDWQASRLIGHSVVRIYDQENERLRWWAQDPDGTLFQHSTPDAETMFRLERQADGSLKEVELPQDVWQPNEDGLNVFWGVNQDGKAAMWVKGDDQEEWTLRITSWTSAAGAPRQYIPLQRGLLRGDPGISLKDRRPVAEILVPRLRNTLLLAGIAFVLIMPLGLLLGLIAGLNEGKLLDRVLSITSLVATATPEFTSGVFLILIFSTWVGWFPGAVVVTDEAAIWQHPEQLILPVLTLGLIELGYLLRITRASMVEVMKTNYIRTAVLKGLPWMRIVFKHALRNALLAPITIIMLHVNWLIGGLVVVEALFGFPGLGRYVLDAALFKDIVAVEAASMVLVVVAILTQLIADILYTYLNPKIRYS